MLSVFKATRCLYVILKPCLHFQPSLSSISLWTKEINYALNIFRSTLHFLAIDLSLHYHWNLASLFYEHIHGEEGKDSEEIVIWMRKKEWTETDLLNQLI